MTLTIRQAAVSRHNLRRRRKNHGYRASQP